MIQAGGRYQNQKGDYFAAGMTYFTVLALFPLLMVAFSVAGFVLVGHPSLLDDARRQITDHVPGSLGDQLNDLVDQAIHSRTSVGIIGLVSGLYAGLGWMGNLRAALTQQWDQQHKKGNWFKTKAGDLGALIGLGLAIIVSLGFSALSSSSVIRQVLEWLHLGNAPGVELLLRIVSIVLSIAATWGVFIWVIARLPREKVTFNSAVRAALLAAVVFEVFKQIASIYLKSVLSSPAGATFGPILGLMVFAYITARIILFATAWAATETENEVVVPHAPEPAAIRPVVQVNEGPSARGAVALVGSGLVAGLGIAGLRRPRKR